MSRQNQPRTPWSTGDYCGVVSFGLTIDKLLLIGIIAVFLIGPDRLPAYSAKLARLIRSMRQMASGAKERMRDEMGPDFDEVEWKKLDPRQYDPRRILRDALVESDTPDSPAAPDQAPQKKSVPRSGIDPDAI